MKNLKLAFAAGYTADSVFGSVRKDRAARSRPGTAIDTSDKWAVIRKHFPKVCEVYAYVHNGGGCGVL